MNDVDQVELAFQVAARAHANQLDKAYLPFILHVVRVGMSLMPDLEAVAAGLLHDVVEDSDIHLEKLREMGFNPEVLDAVAAMTRWPNETYFEYVDRVKKHPLGARVKRADLLDNLAPWRQTFPGWEPLHRRHSAALVVVQEAITQHEAGEYLDAAP